MFRKIFISLVFAVLTVMSVFSINTEKSDLVFRYKITMNVQTPGGLKSGSAVREIVINKFAGFNPEKADFTSKIYGEAVIVDLGEKKLFGLLERDTYNEVFYTFPTGKAPLSESSIAYYKSLPIGTKAILDKKHWPRMVTFADLKDPKSVQPVNQNDLAKTFGEGFKLENIQIEITDESVTRGNVNRYFWWFSDYKNKKARLNGSTSIAISTNELSDNLGTGAFSIGEEK